MSAPGLSPQVAQVFDSYPVQVRPKVLQLRALVYDVAKTTPGVGELTETLKWGEPAYLTAQTRSGSTIRIAWKKSSPKQYGLFFHYGTRLI